jgi:hypothetical protein
MPHPQVVTENARPDERVDVQVYGVASFRTPGTLRLPFHGVNDYHS